MVMRLAEDAQVRALALGVQFALADGLEVCPLERHLAVPVDIGAGKATTMQDVELLGGELVARQPAQLFLTERDVAHLSLLPDSGSPSGRGRRPHPMKNHGRAVPL
jgi:hypothetical protein